MKRTRLALLLAVALALSGCAGIPGGEALTTGVAAVSDALTGPDTDYKNYLSHCRAEVKAQADAISADSKALEAALTAGNEKTQFGAILLLAVKAGQGGPKIGCTVARKKGAVELMLGESNILELGVDLYRENRAGARFKRQMEADNERFRLSTNRATTEQRENNNLLRDLVGTRNDPAALDRAAADKIRATE
ncbi:MAG TPA: hypothetical protein DCY64_22505 [Hydrogenophaga sp.]|uniref:hypothetical protein n=1 Tax=Hydrogenophaga sp. TaxID=1904254 RepID=UPI0008C25DD4|nr:hypothetical protein [Hydrogenophaga sp.]OGA78758.1 MAG: hypothetical protein A2X73_07345 [Burkholderiales bacterium GWE1_65_30]OGA89329.1 MAG: hypothetical protein A2X72_16505 [Burkholderiales bacterium GWF1_66_17]HAX23045.1 hypothetical protein [Hydrogenophaga sp.]